MGEGEGLQDLEERCQRAGCTDHDGEDRVAGGALFLDSDVEVYCKGVVLDGCQDEEGWVSIRNSNHSREDT